jgi:4-hydroxy-3-methylbut-2-enyl diphosphate reductase
MNKTKIIVSSNSGFCFGVRRALDIARAALKERKTVYSLGPIIHNPQVADEFSKRGLKIIKDMKKIKAKEAVLLVPSHGINPSLLKKRRFTLHPEVKGLVGIAGKNSCVVVKDKNEAKALKLSAKAKGSGKAALISQTTASVSNFKGIASEMAKKDLTELATFNTVCKNTIERQKEASRIARAVEAMFVIGGKQSANTSTLAAFCRRANKKTYHIESGKDLRTDFFKNRKSVGVATGASTPPYAIREVIKRIKED